MASSSPLRTVLRTLVRQLAAAVYAVVASSFLDGLTRGSPVLSLVVSLGLVALAAGLVALAVAGPLWSCALVGVFVGLLDLAVVLTLGARPDASSWVPVVTVVLWPSLAGLAGALLVRVIRSRSAGDTATP